jgi:hypothetical protein
LRRFFDGKYFPIEKVEFLLAKNTKIDVDRYLLILVGKIKLWWTYLFVKIVKFSDKIS